MIRKLIMVLFVLLMSMSGVLAYQVVTEDAEEDRILSFCAYVNDENVSDVGNDTLFCLDFFSWFRDGFDNTVVNTTTIIYRGINDTSNFITKQEVLDLFVSKVEYESKILNLEENIASKDTVNLDAQKLKYDYDIEMAKIKANGSSDVDLSSYISKDEFNKAIPVIQKNIIDKLRVESDSKFSFFDNVSKETIFLVLFVVSVLIYVSRESILRFLRSQAILKRSNNGYVKSYGEGVVKQTEKPKSESASSNETLH